VFQARLRECDPGAVGEGLRGTLAQWHRTGQMPPEPPAGMADWLAGLEPARLLITLDDADLLLASPDRGHCLFALLASLAAAGQGRIRCWVAGAPSLARELPTSAAGAGAGGETLWLSCLSQQACHQILQTLFDYLWVMVRPAAILDRLALYGGGHPRILFLLLRELFTQRRHQGRSPFLEAHVEDAWHAAGMRDEAARILLAPLHLRDDLRLALGYILQLAGGEGISRDEMAEFMAFHGLTLAVVDELCELAIVERSGADRTFFRLPASGLRDLIAERFGDGESLMERADAALRGAGGDRVHGSP
jgi:hypothetical protein